MILGHPISHHFSGRSGTYFVFPKLVAGLIVAFLGSTNIAVAHHDDFEPECPDSESGTIAADVIGTFEQHHPFTLGQTKHTMSADGTVVGSCVINGYSSPGGECEVLLTDSPYITGHGIYTKTIERDGYHFVAGESGNLGGYHIETADLLQGTHYVRSTTTGYETMCEVLEPNPEHGYGILYVNTHPPKQKSCPKKNGAPQLFGNPCDASNGNKSQQETDYNSPLRGMDIVRTYNSTLGRDYGLGVGWTASFLKRVDIGLNMVRLRRANGSSEALVDDGGVWQAGLDGTMSLTQDASGYVLTLGNGNTETYDLAGRILTEDLNGYSLSYSYKSYGRK